MKLSIILRKNKLKQYDKVLTPDNMHLIRYKIEHELELLREAFRKLLNKGMINNLRYPKATSRKSRPLVKEMLLSRRNLKLNLKLIVEYMMNYFRNA